MTDNLANKNDLENLLNSTKEGFPQKSLYILELPIFNFENGFPFLKKYLTTTQPPDDTTHYLVKSAQEMKPDILGLKFNIENTNDIKNATNLLKKLLPLIELPLMIRGTGDDSIDTELLPELCKCLDQTSIVASANEKTYQKIIPHTKNQHFLVLQSPIDINLAKEMNILSNELGQPLDRIIIDTNIGSLGYGFEYGYSIIEKIKLESKNDKYLNTPIISFACEEALKTKETKSNDFSPSWGTLEKRIEMFELTAASAIKAAGANLIVLNNPQTLKTMKGLN